MKLQIGSTLQQVRKNKQVTLKELSTDFLSISQLSHIENGDSIPSTEKFIYLISRLNIHYDELIPHLENEYLNAKHTIGKNLAEFSNMKNKDGLVSIIDKATSLYETYNDIYFYHITLQAHSLIELIDGYNFASARIHLSPIKDYLLKTEKWNAYELELFCNCLFIFEIDTAIFFGNRALDSIRDNYHIYRNREMSCTLLNNLATYALDFKEHYLFALECSTLSEDIAYSTSDAAHTIDAKILRQLAYFKLQHGKFDYDLLHLLVETYQLIGWKEKYKIMMFYSKKLGVNLHN